MKNKSLWILGFGLLALVAGCSQTGGTTATTAGTAGGTSAISEPTKPEPAKEVDAGLKNEAFAYMALDKATEYTYSLQRMEGIKATEGTQVVTMSESGPEKAVFSITRAGAMSDLGNEDVEARKDGIYQLKMAMGELDKPMLVMPGDVKEGSSWPSEFTLDKVEGSKKVVFKVDNKAEKIEKVKVPAGEFDCLKVTTIGTMTVDGKVSNLDSSAWYAKNIGSVKLEISVKDSAGKTVKSSVALVSTGEKK